MQNKTIQGKKGNRIKEKTLQDNYKLFKTTQDNTRKNKTKQDKRQNETKQDKTRQDKTMPDNHMTRQSRDNYKIR